jgi:hypothetical protein
MTTKTTKTTKTLDQILKETARFQSRELAFSFAARPPKTLWVMLGDDGRFWVTTPANCARLEKMGYEWAD